MKHYISVIIIFLTLSQFPPVIKKSSEFGVFYADSLNTGYLFNKPADEFIAGKLSAMTIRQKAAQMVISNLIPDGMNINSSEFRRLKKLCEEENIGGFIFFKGTESEYARLSNALQSASDIPLLISADFERGTKMRITDGNIYPNNMAIGAAGNEKLAFEMGAQIAKEMRLIGVQQNYAPVCDVNNNPNNPIINVRSFGEDPELVKRMSEALFKGLQSGKVIATVKHFPGHGDTEIDSHKDLPVLNFDMDRLNKTELVPFKNAIDNGILSVMIAHLSFPVLENKPNIPSSLSKNIVQDLLIDNLGFKGLVVTDALNMKGITKYFSTSEIAVMCVEAGIDLILMAGDEKTTINAIVNAVQSGRITEERLNRSVEKILKAKEWLGLFENKMINDADVYKSIDYDEAAKISMEIAKESITLVKDDNNFLPVKNSAGRTLIISLSDGNDNLNTAAYIQKFSAGFTNSLSQEITAELDNVTLESILSESDKYDNIIIGVFAKVKFGTGKISILNSHSELLNRMAAVSKNFTVISFGNPYLLKEFPSVPSYICAYGDADVSIDAALMAVTGTIHFKGKLPVTINDDYRYGMGKNK
jgi:beta-N-acetylhexosaminidase